MFYIEKNFKLSKISNFNLEDKKELKCQDEYIFYFILKQFSKYKSPSKTDISNELQKIKKGEILNKEIWDKLIINPNIQLYNLFYIKNNKCSKMKFIWLLIDSLDETKDTLFILSLSLPLIFILCKSLLKSSIILFNCIILYFLISFLILLLECFKLLINVIKS